MYYLGQIAVRLFLQAFFRLRVFGRERVPQSGPVLLVVNHISNWDPLTVGCLAGRTVSFMAKEELFRFPPLAALLRRLHAFPVRRGSGDRQALKTALEVLSRAGALIVFPEGTRGSGEGVQRIERGVGMMAMRSGAVLVPVAITGRYRLFGPLSITFGEPFTVASQGSDTGSKRSLDAAADIILQHMRAVVKEAMARG